MIDTSPDTNMGPFIADSKSFKRTLYGTCPFKQPNEYSPMTG